MIIITGAAGFIGSYLVSYFNRLGHSDIIIVDEFTREDKLKNLENKQFDRLLDRDELFPWLRKNGSMISAIIHMGARTDTAEKDREIFERLNLSYSKKIWQFCVEADVPLIYASSAATYGLGEFGYSDSHRMIPFLKPLNPYGDSKQDFD
ncbi:MAG TPA: NAD-dependent epimerase/dehydratase family protein, partial [Saprospiraceae bacterium]|nr:NAD-dependent epimerase/dehydratase family protein [Saprospiraceae bacterium]